MSWIFVTETYARFAARKGGDFETLRQIICSIAASDLGACTSASLSHETVHVSLGVDRWGVQPHISFHPEGNGQIQVSLYADRETCLRITNVPLADAADCIRKSIAEVIEFDTAGFARGYWLVCDVDGICCEWKRCEQQTQFSSVDRDGSAVAVGFSDEQRRRDVQLSFTVPFDVFDDLRCNIKPAWLRSNEQPQQVAGTPVQQLQLSFRLRAGQERKLVVSALTDDLVIPEDWETMVSSMRSALRPYIAQELAKLR